jgi:hypothetical protein
MRKLTIAISLLVLVGCEDGSGTLFPNPPSSTASPAFQSSTPTLASPTPPALPETPPPTRGVVSRTCIEGWTTPDAGSRRASTPIRIINRTVPIPGEPVVVDMRYFTGPESPPSEKGYILSIRRWYVKLYSDTDRAFQGRFLVESREFGDGVAAVAPYDTQGFRSPDWSGFQWNVSDPARRAYPGLPGRWTGIRYDFVVGGAGLLVPGLPAQVVGCLDTS